MNNGNEENEGHVVNGRMDDRWERLTKKCEGTERMDHGRQKGGERNGDIAQGWGKAGEAMSRYTE
jgi:hypothetical protein